ncbi:MAG: hypothetical protein ISR58_12370 [Anaerolineales bacterium]|nr:hypothetical protein [Chloroflexota bacterium]MBL6981973.1 hypothetical protein [Anaerolineales bacterium]
MSEFAQGLQLSVWGLLVTFVSLGVLALLMVFLRELFNEKSSADPEPADSQDDLSIYWEELRIKAAGIAVSVATLQSDRKHSANLGALLESPLAKSRIQRSHNE